MAGLGAPTAVASNGLRSSGAAEELRQQIEQVREQVAKDQAMLQILQNMDRAKLQQTLPHLVPDTQLDQLETRLNQAQQDLIKLKLNYTPDHPNYKNAQEIVEELKKSISERIEGILSGLTAKRESEETYLSQLTAQLSQESNSAEQTNGSVAAVTAQLERDEKGLQELLTRYTAEHPLVVEAKQKVEADRNALEAAQSAASRRAGSLAGGSEGAAPVTDEEQQQIRRIQFMIQNSPDLINAVGSEGITPLQDAAAKGQLSVAEYLLDHGADVNRTGSSGSSVQTPLYRAANNGHKAMVELLISRGADINSFNPLERVVSKNYTSVAEVLLAHNADVNYHGSEARVPLHDAAEHGATNLIQLLISHGADVRAVDNAGATPLHLAARAGEIDAAKMLLAAKAPIDARDKEDSTPLHYAAQVGRANMISLLLDSGASVDPTNHNNSTPLQFAVSSGAAEAVRVLLAHKADPNHPVGYIRYGNDHVYTSRPIYSGIVHTNILEMLLEAGADPDGQLALPTTPLNSALGAANIDSARLLLEHAANPNQPSYGDPPLAVALKEPKDKSAIPLLLEKGADPNAKNAAGLPPLFTTTDPEIGRWLLDHNADINARAVNNLTPLISAAYNTNYLKFLLDAGANPDLQDTNGNTALDQAVYMSAVESVRLLLAHKADPNIQNNFGYTPLDMAKFGVEGRKFATMMAPNVGNEAQGPLSPEVFQKISALLSDAGGMANLPKRNRIEVRRASSSGVIITKGSHDWNRYSLLEIIAGEYGLLTQKTSGEWDRYNAQRGLQWQHDLPFPDFKNVMVYRRVDASAKQKTISVNLEKILNSGDCSQDVWLEWGDVIEIPESDHPVDQRWPGLMNQTVTALTNCTARQVTIIVKGVSTTLKLQPGFKVNYTTKPDENDGLEVTHASFMLRSVMDNSKLVRVSSDLSRVKVTRIDPETKKKQEWTIDCTNPSEADLWLRDGDVIDVPEK